MDAKDKEAPVPRSRGRSVVVLYNTERRHQALGYRTPMTVYRARVSGAVAVDMTLRLDNAGAVPTGPQHQQLTNSSLAA
jgi:hypothetical protein